MNHLNESQQLEADLQLAGFFTKRTEDGRLMIEGISRHGVEWIIEEDFDAWWVYEYTGENYHSVDAFNNAGSAVSCAQELVL